MKHLIHRFNFWAERTRGMIEPFSDSTVSHLAARLERALQPVPYSLSLENDSTTGSLVEVRRNVMLSRDLSR